MKLSYLQDRLNGIFIGEVIDNNDPLNLFRVKVKIENLTDEIPNELLPWYLVKQPVEHSYNSQGKLPNIGTKVWVEFPTKEIYNGIITGVIAWIPPNKG